MKKIITILFGIILFFPNLFGQQIYFNNRYDFNHDCDGSNAILVIPGGYLSVSETDSLCNWGRVSILKLDSAGNVKFKKIYGVGTHFYGIGIGALVLSNDDKYFLAGYKDSALLICKFDNNGDTLWTKSYYDSLYYLNGQSCKLTRDKGFIIVGSPQGKISGIFRSMLIKTDSMGNIQWKRIYNSAGNNLALSVDTCMDGGYIIGSGWNDAELTKTDSIGNVIWQYNYSITSGDASVISLTTRGYAFISGYGSSTKETCVLRVDGAGKQVWFQHYPPSDNYGGSSAIDELKDYGFILGGQLQDSNTVDGSLLRIDSSGNLIWYRNYKKLKGVNSQNYLRDVKPTPDGGFVAGGFCSPSPPDTGTEDVWVLKVDSNGCDSVGHCPEVNTGENEVKVEEEMVKVYPNPTSGIVQLIINNEQLINSQIDISAPLNIEVYNVFGQCVYSSYQLSAISYEPITIDLSSQPNGVYFYRVIKMDEVASPSLAMTVGTGKIVVEK